MREIIIGLIITIIGGVMVVKLTESRKTEDSVELQKVKDELVEAQNKAVIDAKQRAIQAEIDAKNYDERIRLAKENAAKIESAIASEKIERQKKKRISPEQKLVHVLTN